MRQARRIYGEPPTLRSESELTEWLSAHGVEPAARIALIRKYSPGLGIDTPEGTVTLYDAASGKYQTVRKP